MLMKMILQRAKLDPFLMITSNFQIILIENINCFSHSIYIMIDWPGLLKYTLKYSDGTKPTQFKALSKEDQQWLQKALQHYSSVQQKRIQQIIASIYPLTTGSKVETINQLEQILQSLDRGDIFYLIGGCFPLLNLIFNSKYQQDRIAAMRLYSFINNNDAKIQKQSIQSGSLKLIQLILNEQISINIRQWAMSCIGATIRGQYLQGKRIFIDLDGIQILIKLIGMSTRFDQKALTLLSDLVHYDSSLHKRINDTSKFSNTSAIRFNNIKDEKAKIDQQFQNQPKQLIKYKGCVNQKLIKYGMLKKVEQWDQMLKS